MQIINAYWGIGSVAPLIHNIRRHQTVSHGEESPPVPIYLEAVCATETFWTSWRREKFLVLRGNPPDYGISFSSARSSVNFKRRSVTARKYENELLKRLSLITEEVCEMICFFLWR